MSAHGAIILEAKGISKTFPGVKALDNVSLTLRSGCLTALLGENGAGKSTLMNIIAGVFPADAGEVRLAGEVVQFSNPREAREAGIAMNLSGVESRFASDRGGKYLPRARAAESSWIHRRRDDESAGKKTSRTA